MRGRMALERRVEVGCGTTGTTARLLLATIALDDPGGTHKGCGFPSNGVLEFSYSEKGKVALDRN